jgi:hypothetical protein
LDKSENKEFNNNENGKEIFNGGVWFVDIRRHQCTGVQSAKEYREA